MLRIFAQKLPRTVNVCRKNLVRPFCWDTSDDFKGTYLLRSDKHEHYLNPEDVSRRMLRIFASHDNVNTATDLTLATTFHEMKSNYGLDELSKVEVFLEVEKEFSMQLPCEAVERFVNLREAVEYISKSFHAI